MLRIDYFIDHLKVGGAQRHLLELFASLDRRRFALQVTVAKAEGPLVAAVERLGIPVRDFGVGASLARPGTLTRLLATARRLRAERVHVVHGYLYAGNLLGMLAGRLAGVPIRLASKRSLDRSQGGLGLGPLFAGIAFDFAGNYQIIFAIFLGNYLLSALLISLARRPLKENRGF